MSERSTRFDVTLAIGAVALAGVNIVLFASAGSDWLVVAVGVVGVAMLTALTGRFYWRYSGGAGLALFTTGWVIVMLVGFVLSALWRLPDGTTSSSPSEPLIESLALLTVLVTTVPLIMCGLGLLVNVVVSRTRRGSYDEASATY